MAATKNLAEFYDQVKSKGIRLTNQWKMKFNFGDDPSGVLGNVDSALDGETVTIWAEGANVPGRTQAVADLPYQGYNLGIPSNFEMSNEISLTFRGQKNQTYKHAFESWMDTMSNIDFAATGGSGSRVEPALGGSAVAGGGFKEINDVDLQITLMAPNMVDELESYVLKGIFPTVINDTELTNDAPDIFSYGVDFRYQYWYRTPAQAI
jgi:hypothetical protein